MQYLPGFTVQCINPLCEARGHWLRADATTPLGSEGRCPCCGDLLRNVPPALRPRFRSRPRPPPAPPPPPPPPPPRRPPAGPRRPPRHTVVTPTEPARPDGV